MADQLEDGKKLVSDTNARDQAAISSRTADRDG
jgi:hypothetical protein